MNILTTSNYFPEHPGGIEFVAKNLVERWRTKHRVCWVACDIAEQQHYGMDDDLPIPALNFTEHFLGFPYPLPSPWSIKRLFVEVSNCDLVHMHDCLYATNVILFLAAQYHKKPTVITQHVGPIQYNEAYKNLLQKMAYATIGKWLLKNAAQVIFISERVRTHFEKLLQFKAQTLFIPNGVDRKIFYAASQEERETFQKVLNYPKQGPVLIFVGRFTQKKGLDVVREIASAKPDWNWWLIGGGELDPNLWQLNNVRVIPPMPQNELRKYYTAADLFVLPSTGEGFPLAVQEALACGLPVAVSAETASGLTNAPLIKLNTSNPQDMINTLKALLEDKNALSVQREHASSYAAQWDWDIVAAKYEGIFYSLVHNR
jgi:glycosyltransferase involved in cell wall biosynthesis